MKCFGFNYCQDEKGLSIELCQEIIEYHVNRNDGIPVTGNIIIKSLTEGEKYLGIWHRACVVPFYIGESAQWTDNNNLYTHIFFNLQKKRGKLIGDSTIKAKLFTEVNHKDPVVDEKYTENIIIPRLGEYPLLHISDPVTGEIQKGGAEQPIPEYIPYTYAEIGPFLGKDKYYAVRIKTHIDERAFYRFVPENFQRGIRYYQVYGVEEIIDNIICLDLPHLQRYSSEDIYEIYERRFKDRLCDKKLVPKFYSIVAIDSPESKEYDPHRMYSIQLKKGLKDLTEEIWPGLFEHKKLMSLEGRVFWFVNQQQSQSFMLWLEGPMAEAKVKI